MPPDFTELAAPGVRALQPYLPGKPVAELEREYGISNVLWFSYPPHGRLHLCRADKGCAALDPAGVDNAWRDGDAP